MNMRVGSVMSLLGTATGRVFAAFQPTKMIQTFLEAGPHEASVGNEAARRMSRKQIEAALAEVRERGMAEVLGSVGALGERSVGRSVGPTSPTRGC